MIRAAAIRTGGPPGAEEMVAGAQDYYGASLVLLSRLALAEPPEAPCLVPTAPPPAVAEQAPPPARFEFLRRPFGSAPPPAEAPAMPPPPAAAPRGPTPTMRVAPPRWRPDVS